VTGGRKLARHDFYGGVDVSGSVDRTGLAVMIIADG
jgi:hypothetical protein